MQLTKLNVARQKKRLGCRNLTYWGTGRNRFQMEVPDSVSERNIPEEYKVRVAAINAIFRCLIPARAKKEASAKLEILSVPQCDFLKICSMSCKILWSDSLATFLNSI